MTKIICLLFIMLLINSLLFSSTIVTVNSYEEFGNGAAANIDLNFEYGKLGLLGIGAGQNDFFDSAPKGIWQIVGSLPIYVCSGKILTLLGGSADDSLQGPSFPIEEDISVEISAYPPNNSKNGGLVIRTNVESIHFLQDVQNPSAGNIQADGVGQVQIVPGWYELRIEKRVGRFTFKFRAQGQLSWTTLGSRTSTASVFSYGIGGKSTPATLGSQFKSFKIRPLVATGNWTSTAFDLSRTPTTVGNISWRQDLAAGTRTEIQTATSVDGIAWSAWSAPYSDDRGSTITSPSARYIRVAATLYSDPTRQNTPIVDSIRIEYPDAAPLGPILTPLSHPVAQWASPTAVSLLWAMPAGNPAPESTYTYWLRHNGALTATAGAAVSGPPGQAHALNVSLPMEGAYTLDFEARGDLYSGGLTATAQTYSFGYDASAPSQVDISSPTHPPLLFTNNRNPVFQLAAGDSVSGVSGYAAVLDKAATGDPGSAVNAGTELRFSNIDNGTWYLHARAIDLAGNAGPVTHYGIRVDFNGELLSPDYVKALPNPVRTDQARLEYELAAPATEVTLEFLNSQGELLKSVDGGRNVGKNYYSWELGGLANGVYLFRVKARSAEDGKNYSVVRKVAVIR